MKLEELARLAGVSKTTASIILNGKSQKYRISQATCDKVLKLANKYHYIANAQAAGLRNSTSKMMALILPDLMHHGFAELSKHLERLSRKAGFQLLISSSDDDLETEVNLVKTLIGRKVEAIIAVATVSDYSIYKNAEQQGIPVILLDRIQEYCKLDYIVSDDKATANSLAKILLNHGQGDLVYFGGNQSMDNSRHRLAGFKDAITEHPSASESLQIFHQDYSVEAGYNMMRDYYKQHQKLPERLFTASFTLMEGTLQFVRKHLDVTDKSLNWATFGDSYVLDLLPFTVHSARQNYKEMASMLVSHLEKKVNKLPYEHQVILPREIIARK